MSKAEEQATKALDRIESALATLHALMEQERRDLEGVQYPGVGELFYIAGQLEGIESFWAQTGEEYEQ